jgi:hypothetical protein
MDNDEASYNFYREIARHYVKELGKDKAPREVSECVKGQILENGPDLGASMYADLLGSALDNVNWREIAESLIEGLE